MGYSVESSLKDYQQRVMEARQLAEISGLDFKTIFEYFLFNGENRFLSSSSGHPEPEALSNFRPETTGFKTEVDHLNDWNPEESSQYLFHNIFCFR